MDYRWESVQEEDFAWGVMFMFTSTVLGFVLLFCIVVCYADSEDVILGFETGEKKTRH